LIVVRQSCARARARAGARGHVGKAAKEKKKKEEEEKKEEKKRGGKGQGKSARCAR